MTEDNVIELNSDTLFYIKSDGENISGVGDSAGMVEFINSSNGRVGVYSEGDLTVEKHKFKQLCIAWLALNYPDSLSVDG